MTQRPIEILLVEDNVLDVKLTREALKEGKISNNLHVARDGEEALNFLFRRGDFADAIRPDIVLLDLNLPRVDGREVLAKVKADPGLRPIPVVVLTTSKADQDIVKSYDLNVNCYITKPVDMSQFVDVVRAIDRFWFSVVTLPQDEVRTAR
jgi:two-component system, chemotaxis family, response regulator Rcp1